MQTTKAVPIYDSQERGFAALAELSEVLRYRHLVAQIVRRDILTRYKRSILGVAWTMLNPLGMMLVMTIVFSRLFGRTPGYPVYVLSGLIAWLFFAQASNATIRHQIWGGGILKRIYAPRTTFAISAIGTGLINLALSTVPLVLVMLVTRIPIRPSVLFLPVPMFLLACFTLGFGLLISTIGVYFPDVVEMYQIVLRAWMYLTPIIYPEHILPGNLRQWLTILNPMYPLVKIYRAPIQDGRLPSLSELAFAAGISLVVLILGWVVFTNKSDEFTNRL